MTDVSFRFELLQAPTTVVHPTPRPLVQTPEAKPRITGVHPAVIKIAMSAVVWFLAVAWLDFMGGPEVDTALAVSTGFFVMFFTLLLVAASMVVDDPRWREPAASFKDFLKSTVPVDRGMMRGREVLIHIVLLPMS